MRFDTLAVHAGAPAFTIDGAHPTTPPLVPASSYWYDSADDLDRVPWRRAARLFVRALREPNGRRF